MTGLRAVHGRALVLGHDVNTDELHPSRFYSLDDRRVLEGFLGAVPGRTAPLPRDDGPGLVVVAGRSFGVGSSRETGARVFQLAGVRAIVAGSFARIFQRNVLNLGLPALVCPALNDDALDLIAEGAPLRVDPVERFLLAPTGRWTLDALDPFHQALIAAGGLTRLLEIGE